MQERKKYFEPQVLRIDDYAEPVLDDNHDDDIDDVDDDNNNYEIDDELNKYENTKKNESNLIKKSQLVDNNSRASSAASINILNSNSSSLASSRVTTGDTGYASTSDVSFNASLSLSKQNLKISSQNTHQPVIVTSSTNAPIKSPAALTSKNGLKQLKSNLAAPLSSLKFPKN